MFVKDWMTLNPLTLRPDATISFVARKMSSEKVRHFLITETSRAGERLVGIVSQYDIARGFPDSLNPLSVEVFENSVPRTVSTVMTKNPITTYPDCPIEEAAEVLRVKKINALPVLEKDCLVGIITSSDILKAFTAMTSARSGVRVVIESDNEQSPVHDVIELSRKNRFDILGMVSYREVHRNGKVTSMFRLSGGTVPTNFSEEITHAGFRLIGAKGEPAVLSPRIPRGLNELLSFRAYSGRTLR